MAALVPYATRVDVLARYEAEFVDRLCWDRVTGVAVLTRLDLALADASAELNSYVSTRYQVPFGTIPELLKRMCCDIAIYYVALTHDKLTEEISTRYQRWQAHLKLIATGQAGLGVREDASDTDTNPAIGTGTGALISRSSRRV